MKLLLVFKKIKFTNYCDRVFTTLITKHHIGNTKSNSKLCLVVA